MAPVRALFLLTLLSARRLLAARTIDAVTPRRTVPSPGHGLALRRATRLAERHFDPELWANSDASWSLRAVPDRSRRHRADRRSRRANDRRSPSVQAIRSSPTAIAVDLTRRQPFDGRTVSWSSQRSVDGTLGAPSDRRLEAGGPRPGSGRPEPARSPARLSVEQPIEPAVSATGRRTDRARRHPRRAPGRCRPAPDAPASRRWTSPSISGASALERPVAPPSPSTASMITSIVAADLRLRAWRRRWRRSSP